MIQAADRTPEAHHALLAAVPAMQGLEVCGRGPSDPLPADYRVVAWNLERCLFPQKTAAHLAPHAPSVLLLGEMDNGMARAGQANTTAEIAAAMGMHYVYGVEFYEMDLGGPTERAFCKDDFNARGFHGNAILSKAPLEKLALIRLDQDGHWFLTGAGSAGDPQQPRMGGRMAVAAVIPTVHGPVCFVSTHLESNADATYRQKEFDRLLDAVDAFAPGLPVMIGGDLNTGNHLPPEFDWREETLFARAEARGYSWAMNPDGVTTRASLITPHQSRKMKLDWFAVRNMQAEKGLLLSSVASDGVPLSDHDAVLCTVTG